MEILDWIKSASNVTKKGDIDEYAHLMWSRCLGLAGVMDFALIGTGH